MAGRAEARLRVAIVIASPRLELHPNGVAGDFPRCDSDIPTRNLRIPRSTDRASTVEAKTPADTRTESVSIATKTPGNKYPDVGSTVDGFEILSELGRGSMGRVYLARQSAPTERTVVLKVGPHLSAECQKLAKLQHVNVVPVYSFHTWGSVQAVCMPYRGSVTLAHLVTQLRDENIPTLNGKALTTVLERCRRDRSISSVPASEPVSTANRETALERPTMPLSGAALKRVRRLNFVDAVLTIVRQIVDGLRVAHAEGIVHGDLKPANIVLADDGTAQLIDFGVAIDLADHSGPVRIGGTRPYMSPEQLKAFRNATREFDVRSDLYAVGVLLYELLSGRYPYDYVPDSNPNALDWDYANRFRPPMSLRTVNKGVPPAVESIVGRCLTAKAEDRYQSAEELREDLDRQLARRPLRYAANPSRAELVRKWVSRHRIATIVAGGLAAGLLGAAGVAARESRNERELTHYRALAAADAFVDDTDDAQFTFALAENDPASRTLAWDTAHRALGRFDIETDAVWFQRLAPAGLPDDRVTELRRRAAGLLVILANDRIHTALRERQADARTFGLAEARAWNERAAETHPHADGGPAANTQRAYLDRLVNGSAIAIAPAPATPDHPDDAITLGRLLLAQGRARVALPHLTAAGKANPKSYWAHFYAAVCHHNLGEYRDAVAKYDICVSLRPDYYGTIFNRGLARLRLAQFADAEADFEKTLTLRPNLADAYFQRAIAREGQKRFVAAVEDLGKALECGYTATSVYLVRSRVYGRIGNREAADRDAREGLRVIPTDERGWLARAQSQILRDPVAARSDYERVLELNPVNTVALQGLAHVLGVAGQDKDVVRVLTELLAINEDVPDAWSGRGVHRARLKDRDGAHADAREALCRSDAAATKYQVAGIFATTSRTHSEDRREALSLLDAALRGGFGFDHLEKDTELDPIRNDPEFQLTVDAARSYRSALKRVD